MLSSVRQCVQSRSAVISHLHKETLIPLKVERRMDVNVLFFLSKNDYTYYCLTYSSHLIFHAYFPLSSEIFI